MPPAAVRVGRRLAAALVIATALALPAGEASAHPLGNFTVNVYSGLRVQPDRLLIDLVVDMAEIPTFQARRDIDADGDGTVGGNESAAYATEACRDAGGRIDVAVDGRRVTPRPETAGVEFPAGEAGLPTLRLSCALVAPLGDDPGGRQVVFRNRNHDQRAGWREIVAVGDRTELAGSTVAATSISSRLTQYPADLFQSPPDQRTASFTVRPGGPAVDGADPASAPAVGARGVDRFSRSFTRLVARQDLSVAFGLLAVGIAIVLGAAHALAPGHGKTLMAAYLVGQRGSFTDAWLIGATMAVTHTAGVLLLGVVLSASTSLAAESLYPWLRLVSGLLLAGIGASLLYRAAGPGLRPAVHEHAYAHAHPHDHVHLEGPATPRAAVDAPVRWRGLVAMGLVGGLLPSPSALVVLLGAIALGRAWFGVVLVGAYGVGMAATLLATGLLLARAQAGIAARLARSSPGRITLLTRVLPTATAAVVLTAGLVFAVQGAARI